MARKLHQMDSTRVTADHPGLGDRRRVRDVAPMPTTPGAMAGTTAANAFGQATAAAARAKPKRGKVPDATPAGDPGDGSY